MHLGQVLVDFTAKFTDFLPEVKDVPFLSPGRSLLMTRPIGLGEGVGVLLLQMLETSITMLLT